MFARMFKDVSVRRLLTGSVILVSLLSITLTGFIGWNAYQRHEIAIRLTVMNDIADKIIFAAAQEALERGTAATALGSTGTTDSDDINRIQKFRKEGDAALNEALSAAQNIADKEPGSQLAAALGQTASAHKTLALVRERVDSGLKEGTVDVPLIIEWFTAMTDVIEHSARLRHAAFVSSDPLQQISQDNIILKQAVWIISENMGRERGTLGPIIAAGKPVPRAVLEKLNVINAMVELNVSNILAIKGVKGTDYRIDRAIVEMEKWMERFSVVRNDVYAAAGSGDYPLNAGEWMARSTEAIDKVLAVSDAISEVSSEKAKEATGKSFNEVVMAIIQMCLILLFALSVLMLVYIKVCRIGHLCVPMGQLAQGEGD